METTYKISRYIVGPFATNCYLVQNHESGKGVIIDPGGDADVILDAIRASGMEPVAILLTHGHIDHLMAVPEIQTRYNLPVYVHEAERPMLASVSIQAEMFGLPNMPSPEVSVWLKEGDLQIKGGLTFGVIHTPGHSPGGCCYLMEDGIFVGDTLFESSIGRTDLPGGDYDQLIRSIKEKLFTLPDETIVYPGHGGFTSIGQEKRYNPFLRGVI